MKDTPPEGDRAEDLPKKVPSRWAGGVTLASPGAQASEAAERALLAVAAASELSPRTAPVSERTTFSERSEPAPPSDEVVRGQTRHVCDPVAGPIHRAFRWPYPTCGPHHSNSGCDHATVEDELLMRDALEEFYHYYQV